MPSDIHFIYVDAPAVCPENDGSCWQTLVDDNSWALTDFTGASNTIPCVREIVQLGNGTLSQCKDAVLASTEYDKLINACGEDPDCLQWVIMYKGNGEPAPWNEYDMQSGDGPGYATMAEIEALIALGSPADQSAWAIGYRAPYTKDNYCAP